MNLDIDCVRDILILLTEKQTMDVNCERTKPVYLTDLFDCKELSDYPHDVISYTVKKLGEANYLDLSIKWNVNSSHIVVINDITFAGHQFVSSIQKDTVWNGVKGVAKKVGTTSLSALTQIASSVITELIKAQFGLSGMPPQIT